MNGPRTGESDLEERGILRRHFVAIATAHYADPNFPPLPVDTEVAELQAWLCNRDVLGDRAFTVPDDLAALARDPDMDQIRTALRPPAKPWTFRDAAVVFVTGHGGVVDTDHWTILSDSCSDDLPNTALRTAELVGWLAATKTEHLLLIIDTCFAGTIAEQILRRNKSLPASWLILPSASKEQTAIVGALTEAIGQAVEKLRGGGGRKWGTGDRHFSPAAFLDTVKEFLVPGQMIDQMFRGRLTDPHFCLPNPHFTPPSVVQTGPARHELALPKDDLGTHWGPRSRGVEGRGTPGWLFTGRAGLMKELIRTLGGEPGTTLITGAAGCGKSAVLARLVTLSDPDFLAAYHAQVADIPANLRPEPLAVDVAVLASRRWPPEILDQLSKALGIPHPDTPGWDTANLEERAAACARWLSTRPAPVTIVLDALDEAYDPRATADLLVTLTSGQNASMVRLLVGVRSPGGPGDPSTRAEAGHGHPLADYVETKLHAHRLRVDDGHWWDQDDVRAYAASILGNTRDSPYVAPEHRRVADCIAQALADHAGRSFLIARITATSLAARRDVIDPDDRQWLAAVDDGVIGVFRDDLWHTFPDEQSRREAAITLLRAVAYAHGRGLPWGNVWPAVANAIADTPYKYGDNDVGALLDSRMSAYLVSDREDDTTVYRLFHEMLRTTLREDWEKLLVDPGALT